MSGHSKYAISGFFAQAFRFVFAFVGLAGVAAAAILTLWLWFPETIEAARTSED